jgi:putative flippase GtrA
MANTAIRIAFSYTIFAAISTIINIVSQLISIWTYKGPFFVEISILVGTAAGLPLRYFLEKRYIFIFTSKNLMHDGKLFILYSGMGIVSTLIFWGMEYTFHLVYNTEIMRYFGGVIGLAIGFFVKYQLDKKYVFVGNASESKL